MTERLLAKAATRLYSQFAFCDPVALTFDLILTGRQGLVIDYPCAKSDDFGFSCFGFIVHYLSSQFAGNDVLSIINTTMELLSATDETHYRLTMTELFQFVWKCQQKQ